MDSNVITQGEGRANGTNRNGKGILLTLATFGVFAIVGLSSCSGGSEKKVEANGPVITVGVTKVVKKTLGQQLTLSSELVPFQEIDVYAKESGFVKKLLVDYGTHVKAGQVMAVLEIPELEAQLQEDQAEIKNATNQVTRAQHELEPVPGAVQSAASGIHAVERSISEPARHRRTARSG